MMTDKKAANEPIQEEEYEFERVVDDDQESDVRRMKRRSSGMLNNN